MSFYIGKIRIPIVEPNFEVSCDRDSEIVDILNYGKVTVLGNKGLSRVTYNSYFPHEYNSYLCDTSSIKKPKKYVEALEKIRDGENYVRVRIDDINFNKMCKISSFSYSTDNPLGDIAYQITLEEYIKPNSNMSYVKAESTNEETVTAFNGTLQGDYREVKTVDPTTYVVKSGDCLCSIARSFNMQWTDLYEDNKDIIGNDPNLIYPNQVLKIRGTNEEKKEKIMALNSAEYYEFRKQKGH